MTDTLEFTRRRLNTWTPRIDQLDCLDTPLPQVTDAINGIVVNGSELPVGEDVLPALVNALQRLEWLRDNDRHVDCNVFGILACGGAYGDVDAEEFAARTTRRINQRIVFSQIVPHQDYGASSPIMEPTILGCQPLGKPAVDAEIHPVHLLVRLTEGRDFYVQKIGGEVVISTLAEAAGYYSSSRIPITLAGSVAALTFATYPEGEVYLEYESSRAASVVNPHTYSYLS